MEPSAEIRELTLRLYEAMSSGDVAFLEDIYSRREGVHFIGTHPDEWWTDYESHDRAIKAQLRELRGIRFVAGGLWAYAEGNVGWVADHPRAHLPDGTEIPVRATFVLHREAGQWKIVQAHVSLGQELTADS